MWDKNSSALYVHLFGIPEFKDPGMKQFSEAVEQGQGIDFLSGVMTKRVQGTVFTSEGQGRYPERTRREIARVPGPELAYAFS